nr:hypothetical protein [Candidatus Sigynarchaeota archaeon]
MQLGFKFNVEGLLKWIVDMIFGGDATLSISAIGTFITKILSFFEFTPRFHAGIEVSGFDSEKNPLIAMLLSTLGLELSFSGGGDFVLQLLSIKNGALKIDSFFKVISWSFHFELDISRTFTILDFLTGGAGGVLNEIGSYIGLDSITITVFFGIRVTISKKAASDSGAEHTTLEIALTIGLAAHIGLDLLIMSFDLYGSLELTFTFKQDLSNPGKPLEIWFTITLSFSFVIDWPWPFGDTDLGDHWHLGTPVELTPHKDGGDDYNKNVLGGDYDEDGLSDDYEATVPGLNALAADTDGDGLSDKKELTVSKTDPTDPDTDGDGLNDYDEYEVYHTCPVRNDTDYDGLSDYEEVILIGTDPFVMDTDEDGLDDYFETTFAWDISGITPSVSHIKIGNDYYDDHTDPLNPDTDNDGLKDGEEGPNGAYYGPALYNATEVANATGQDTSVKALIFNGGYTHPLDNDTDDDSRFQFSNGVYLTNSQCMTYLGKTSNYLRSMTDREEIQGVTVQFYNLTTEEWEWVKFRTNPCNPDTDGDSGFTELDFTDPFNIDPLAPLIFNSDGYELYLTPPSDPTDGDTDDDGLLDGLEGFLRYDSNHTDYLNPDTDGDGLMDREDMLLGTDPRNADSDNDMVTDGDEVYMFHTNPLYNDTDYDLLTDGEEIFIFHSNPLAPDSDADKYNDGYEVMVLGTDPMDDDTDNDGLNDWDEINIYLTDPLDQDSDDDGLTDGQEVFGVVAPVLVVTPHRAISVIGGYFFNKTTYSFSWTMKTIRTNPLNWDTDSDSLMQLNASGQPTFPLSDYDEIYTYHTDPTIGDTDMDGLSDAMELYLSIGDIPYFDFPDFNLNNGSQYNRSVLLANYDTLLNSRLAYSPYRLSPHMNDSDCDGLIDGQELRLVNVTFLFYPFISLAVVYPFQTSPIYPDLDGDGIPDGVEVLNFISNPNSTDSDLDRLTDDFELEHLNWTAITRNDTDGDGLDDYTEVNSGGSPLDPRPGEDTNSTITINMRLDPLLNDTDGDGASDGAEIHYYHTDPTNPSSFLGSNLPDGEMFDSDHDGLNDAVEIMNYKTYRIASITQNWADSDDDGVSDYDEVVKFGTNPSIADTDYDGYGDALEIVLGTDPKVPDDYSAMQTLIESRLNGQRTILVVLPFLIVLAFLVWSRTKNANKAQNRSKRRGLQANATAPEKNLRGRLSSSIAKARHVIAQLADKISRFSKEFMSKTRGRGWPLVFNVAILAFFVPNIIYLIQAFPVFAGFLHLNGDLLVILMQQIFVTAAFVAMLIVGNKLMKKMSKAQAINTTRSDVDV